MHPLEVRALAALYDTARLAPVMLRYAFDALTAAAPSPSAPPTGRCGPSSTAAGWTRGDVGRIVAVTDDGVVALVALVARLW